MSECPNEQHNKTWCKMTTVTSTADRCPRHVSATAVGNGWFSVMAYRGPVSLLYLQPETQASHSLSHCLHLHLACVCLLPFSLCVFVIQLYLFKELAISVSASICIGARSIHVTLNFFPSLHSLSTCHRCRSKFTVMNSALPVCSPPSSPSLFSYSFPVLLQQAIYPGV